MTPQEEKYVHFKSCMDSLNNAWSIIKTIKNETGNPLIGAAFRFALIEYAKPYNKSRGNTVNNLRLDTSCVPQDMLSLHKRITDSRDQIHAHADLTVTDAKIFPRENHDNRFTGIIKNKISGVEELSNIDDIQKLIESTLDNMYEKEKKLISELP